MRYKVTVAYDGSNYNGWQTQLSGNSIQNVIEAVLSQICAEKITIVASGRTDKGVHALGQVFHFDTERNLTNEKWQYVLNTKLPHDIRIIKVEQVEETFHARFSACKKTYRYIFSNDLLNPFTYQHKTLIKAIVDIEKMQEVANIFIGEHDFTSFCSSKIDERKPRVKTIYSISVEQINNDIILTFSGNGFLRYMVRMLSQVILEVGKNTLTKEEVKKMLVAKDKHCNRFKAESNGLYLVSVEY